MADQPCGLLPSLIVLGIFWVCSDDGLAGGHVVECGGAGTHLGFRQPVITSREFAML